MSFKKNMSNLKFRNMKSLKIFVIMGLMLLFGGTCFAQQQEEFQRDSVWGLEWNLQDSILTMSFMSSCDGYVAVGLSWYYGGVYSRNTERNAGMYLNEDGGYWTCGTSAEDDMDFVSLNIDTLSTELTRYILSMKLKDIFLTIPQDISSYCGYFGIKFFAPNHMHSVYEVHSTDYTKCQQFLYFNLLDTLTSSEEYRQEEEFQRDSVWGLEWNLQDSILTVSFMSSCDGFESLEIASFIGGVYNDSPGERFKRCGLIVSPRRYTAYSTMQEDIIYSSLMVDTISANLTKYTLSVKLGSVYLTIPQDLSSYPGYFGVRFWASYSPDIYRPYDDDLTKCSQFLYFNLLDTLTSSEEYRQEEEFQRDSVWGLEWNLQDSILTVSFMSSCDGFFSFQLMSFRNGVYNGYDFFERISIANLDGDIISTSTHLSQNMSFVSCAIDTISVALTRYTISVSLNSIYLTIPQDISTYCGYFGIIFQAENHRGIMYDPYEDLTKVPQFLYFNLIDALSWNVDNVNDDTLFRETYYSMTGVPLREMPENEPVIVVRKSADNQVVSSRVCMRRR